MTTNGSRPVFRGRDRHPALPTGNVDFAHPRIFDSDTILEMKEKPSTLCVYGAGVVGTEYASMLSQLGIKVNLVNTRAKLLEFLDDEIIDPVVISLA